MAVAYVMAMITGADVATGRVNIGVAVTINGAAAKAVVLMQFQHLIRK
jgi:hypothetical protein